MSLRREAWESILKETDVWLVLKGDYELYRERGGTYRHGRLNTRVYSKSRI